MRVSGDCWHLALHVCFYKQLSNGKLMKHALVMLCHIPEVVEGIACDELQKNLIGKRVTGAGRKAKHLWLEMGEGGVPALYLHFGMTGSIIVKSPSGALTAAKYERCALAPTMCWNALEYANHALLGWTADSYQI